MGCGSYLDLLNNSFLNLAKPYCFKAISEGIIKNGTANKVLSSAAGSFTITFNASSEFLWFAHFAQYNDKTTWYVDGNNNGTIGSKLFDNPQVSSVDSPDTYWTNINFDIYISYYATTTVGGMTFS